MRRLRVTPKLLADLGACNGGRGHGVPDRGIWLYDDQERNLEAVLHAQDPGPDQNPWNLVWLVRALRPGATMPGAQSYYPFGYQICNCDICLPDAQPDRVAGVLADIVGALPEDWEPNPRP